MGGIGLATALRHARNLLTQDWQALLLYLAMGVLIPFLLHAAEPALSLRALVAVAANGGWFSGSIAGPLYLLAFASILWTAAQFALWHALLPELREGPIGEILYGFVAALAFLVSFILLQVVISLVVGVPWALITRPAELQSETMALVISGLSGLLQLAIGAFIASRFCLAGPIMAASGSMNPFSGLRQSWARTAPARFRLFWLFMGLQLLGALVFGGLLAGHVALIFADPLGEGMGETLMALVWFAFWTILFLVQTLVAAGLFRASEEGSTTDVFA